MNTKQVNRILAQAIYSMVVVAMVFSVSTVTYAAPPSPFVGNWEAMDVDGSDMNLTIGGPPAGPFQITWTDDYISFCAGEAGIVRGTGLLNTDDSNLLEGDMHLECFTTGDTLDFPVAFRYHPDLGTLFVQYSFGRITIWHRPNATFPTLNLRVNYEGDWVESFYESGHTAWITVTESDGITVKATAELITEPKEYWGWEPGFQSMDSVWFDAEGNPMEYLPDIQPYDWVYGWVDNGASAKVKIGEISGKINLLANSIEGTVTAPWIKKPVQVECLDWGSGQDPSFDTIQDGSILADGSESYSCSWDEWDVQPGQNVGVGYFEPNGSWVANAITAPNPRIIASEVGNWFWTTEFYPGPLDLYIYESENEGEGANLLWSDQRDADEGGFVIVDDHGLDLVPGNYVVVSDGVNQKELVLQPISISVFDTTYNFMAGTAPAGSEVWAAAGPMDWQERIPVQADPISGEWLADFGPVLDMTEDMRPWSYAQLYDEDGDANEGSTPPPQRILAQISDNWFLGENFTPNAELIYEIYDAPDGTLLLSGSMQADENGTAGVWVGDQLDLVPGDYLIISDGSEMKDIVLEALTFDVFNLTNGHLEGTAPNPLGRAVWAGIGWENDSRSMVVTTDEYGAWFVDFDEQIPSDYEWVAAQVFDADGDISEVRPTSQIIFLRPSCGDTYTVQAGGLLEIRYGSWAAIGEDLANQNAEHLTVELVLNGEVVPGIQQPVVPASEFPCGTPPEDAYGVYYIAQVDSLSSGTYLAEVTWTFDQPVTDGYDADGDGVPDWYAGELTREFMLTVP